MHSVRFSQKWTVVHIYMNSMHKNLIMHKQDSCPTRIFFLIWNCNCSTYEDAKILRKSNLSCYKWFACFERTQASLTCMQHYWHKWEKRSSWVPLFLTFSTYGSNSRKNISLDWVWRFQSQSEWTLSFKHNFI